MVVLGTSGMAGKLTPRKAHFVFSPSGIEPANKMCFKQTRPTQAQLAYMPVPGEAANGEGTTIIREENLPRKRRSDNYSFA